MQNATRLVQQHMASKTVVPVIGNHDWFPKDQLPGNRSELYDVIGEMWRQWLPGDALESFKNGTLPALEKVQL